MRYEACVLIVEDDLQIQNFIAYALTMAGLTCVAAKNAAEAAHKLETENINLLLLDLGLPDADGIEIIKKVREASDMPIIVVSARGQDSDKVLALDSGADDYLTKPFSAAELMARVRVALRHIQRQGGCVMQHTLVAGGLKIDFDKRLFYLNNEEVHVTPMEYQLLSFLFKNIGKVMTSKQIIAEVWGSYHGTNTQALRALMASLRRKIEENPSKPRYILTEVGVGYRLVDR